MASLYRRNNTWYAKWYPPGSKTPIRKSLETDSKKVAEARLREIEQRLDTGDETPFPTKTPIPVVLEAFVAEMYSTRDHDSVAKDLSNFRVMSGEVTDSLKVKNRKIAEKKAALRKGTKRKSDEVGHIHASSFESIKRWSPEIEQCVKVESLNLTKADDPYEQHPNMITNWTSHREHGCGIFRSRRAGQQE